MIRAMVAEWAKRVWEWAQHDEALLLEDVADEAFKRYWAMSTTRNENSNGTEMAHEVIVLLAMMKADGHNISGHIRALLYRG